MDAYLNYDKEAEEQMKQEAEQMHLPWRLVKDRTNPYTYFRDEEFQIRYPFRKDAAMELTEMETGAKKDILFHTRQHAILLRVLKKRFPALHYGIQFSPRRSATVIAAACVLYNYGVDLHDVGVLDDFIPDIIPVHNLRMGKAAEAERQALIQNHFM
ncbi:hypothetical protein PoB_005091200 [Plakobranchus ocellatus]|uniref:DDE Tnp4 domain-containing protein n=1 Tax=Plakobranchus ocellatus TaxID=259542 RepID=A0AAV4BZF1_9GAST|nr:hypothetical protein PoB_005091200 [Plakobranchus ocellatus]